jgi:hypothetical protein
MILAAVIVLGLVSLGLAAIAGFALADEDEGGAIGFVIFVISGVVGALTVGLAVNYL